jgi:hypothetical protein
MWLIREHDKFVIFQYKSLQLVELKNFSFMNLLMNASEI